MTPFYIDWVLVMEVGIMAFISSILILAILLGILAIGWLVSCVDKFFSGR